MNNKHAIEILRVLAAWYAESDSGPSASSQLFSDDLSLKVHIDQALGGIPLQNEKEYV